MKIVYLEPLKRLLSCCICRIKPAFSLVEMLMALLVASLLMAALAPVMTRKTELASFEGNMNPPVNSMWLYTNPGSYAFEIPDSVNKIAIQASGGGGGGAGASFKTYKEEYKQNKTFTVPKGVYEMSFTLIGGGGAGGSGYARNASDSCGSGKQIPGMADSGRDLCAIRSGPTVKGSGYVYVTQIVNAGESCDAPNCCWINVPDCVEPNCAYPRTVCKYDAAVGWCASDTASLNGAGRLLTQTEVQRIVDDVRYVGSNGLNLCGLSDDASMEAKYSIPGCGIAMSCFGSSNNHCYRAFVWLANRDEFRMWGYPYFVPTNQYKDQANSVICARDLNNWHPYTGAGGSSGSKYTNTIKVNPGDTIELTLGEGGNTSAAGVKGGDGGVTYLYHTDKKTGNKVTYYAGGGTGGNAATANANGVALTSCNPSCSQGGSCSFAISINGGKGYAGSSIQGGAGAGVGNTNGGTIEINKGRGDDARANTGNGGGGGACTRNVRTPSLCSSGGRGGSGYAEIEYSIASPGGGGGAGGGVGINSETHISKSINLNVTPGEVLNITIGAGGSGGGVNASGYDGGDTILLTKKGTKYTFKGGKGGQTGTFDALNRQIGGIGGIGGNYPDTSKNEYPEIVAPLTTKGMNGAEDENGISGGEGGESVNAYNGGCGGMQISDDAQGMCNSNSENGENAIRYDASANRYGGTGGGGGGINPQTGNKGIGGSGSDGYLLIRWDK